MREQVTILLNEREPVKAAAALELSRRLKDAGITVSRMGIGSHVIEQVKLHQSEILILDYLLGDYSTGLDILSALSELPEAERPQVIFLTDEPSVAVAVNALKEGAHSYYEIDNPQSLQLVFNEIKDLVKPAKVQAPPPQVPVTHLDELIAHSTSSRGLISEALKVIDLDHPIVVLCGPGGSGLTTLARSIHFSRKSKSLLKEINQPFFDQNWSEFLRERHISPDMTLALGHGLSLIVDNVKEDDGELLEILGERRNGLWPSRRGKSPGTVGSWLTLCTYSEEIANAWQNLLEAQVIRLPALSQRKEDIPGLVQRFGSELSALSGEKFPAFTSSLLGRLSDLSWPGNLRQLRDVVVSTLVCGSSGDTSLEESLTEQLSLSELNESSGASLPINALMVARVFEESNYIPRIAAARLGISIKGLKQLLGGGLANAK